MLSVALPKGRLGDKAYAVMAMAGFSCPQMETETRSLIFENREAGVRYFLVKPSDVPVYVEHGASGSNFADVAVDILDYYFNAQYPAQEIELENKMTED